MVVLRRPCRVMLVAQEDNGQQLLGFIEADRRRLVITGYEYAVLVTNLEHEVLSLGQLYRDRADAENTFDELKNQWGWGGFTTHDLHRANCRARCGADLQLVESVCPPGQPGARREAITSRPWLMSSVGRRTDQTTITLTGLHAHFARPRADAHLQPAMRSCGAVEYHLGLAAVGTSQAHPRRNRPADFQFAVRMG